MRKRLYALLGIISFTVAIQTTMSVQAAEPLVVVIDPGHGGDNLEQIICRYLRKTMIL